MNILERIINHKKKEVAERVSLYPTTLLQRSPYFQTTPLSLVLYLKRPEGHGIIAEIKRKSPSKGAINLYVDVEQTSIGYMQSGASALSVLTDNEFFGGSNADLTTARKFNYCPILRKDFIIDKYQITEAKSIGADAILLIAAALTPEQCRTLAKYANDLNMEVLLEVHNRNEIESYLNEYVQLVGVNNRDLRTFETRLETSLNLAEIIPDSFLKISESGLKTPKDVELLKQHGYSGFLMGERFMQEANPAKACSEFIRQLSTNAHSKSVI
ncbi:Indole-3-glycerol phosphate synthase [Owenweeksia hongkongensis DSM 17368]|uniref:Indole-3-glycerol phosphate synthase n=1 Tax=Owenweeksia hongkongensis (strain DSM 17368 / CIP 108786 / JCM 12287 / NRRL B-23963 / UST20020801) TaxID=926562 RepID=G8R335_OWEHD|nr:indole-3-glycerol phosphate synthase TrpC [Owenweeksia hongkongensis]AEV34060.1 Indole-3-glycerol phosphate synthase [Owenweeksia hongkongensis DSM 17368]